MTAPTGGLAAIAPASSSTPRIVFRRIGGPARLRAWAGAKPAASARPGGALLAEFADGPLEGRTREVTAIEGRPPKTIDVELGERAVRYCLAEWEQSGHSAVYGYLYDVPTSVAGTEQ